MTQLSLASIAFNRPRLVGEQIRLLKKYLDEDYVLNVVDNSSDEAAAGQIAAICVETGTPYHRVTFGEHVPALNWAWHEVLWPSGAPYVGMLDHDVFPTCQTRLIPRIDDAGFAGVGQMHGPSERMYLWPGFAFFRRSFVGDRPVSWDGIRNGVKADDGDTGSALWPLFSDDDWRLMFRGGHSYEAIRPPDKWGSQSWAIERFWSDWIHFSNASDWKQIPNPREREAILWSMLEGL